MGRAPHTEECRERFRNLLKETAKVKNAEVRKREFVDRQEKKKQRKF